MRAIIINKHGGIEQLCLADIPVPEPGPGQLSKSIGFWSKSSGCTSARGHRSSWITTCQWYSKVESYFSHCNGN